MEQRQNDHEVFDYLFSDDETPSEIDFLAYAMFAFRKREWIKHSRDKNEKSPSQEEINAWIGALTNYDFVQMKLSAAEFFDDAAKTYLEDFIESEKKKAIDNSIVKDVKSLTSPWRHALIALVMAIVVPVMLGGALWAFGTFHAALPFHETASQATRPP